MYDLTDEEKRLELLGQSEYIYNDFYDLSSKLKLDYIKRYINGVNWQIEYIFDTVEKIHNDTLRKIFLKEIKNIFLIHFSLGDRKTFENIMDSSVDIYTLQKDSERFYQNFKENYLDMKNKIVSIFKKYYECVLESGKKEDYKEFYAYYQTLLLSILYMLPQSYAKRLLETDEYKGIKDGMKIYKYNESLEDVNTKSVYLDSLELSIKKTLCDKYGADVYGEYAVLKKSI